MIDHHQDVSQVSNQAAHDAQQATYQYKPCSGPPQILQDIGELSLPFLSEYLVLYHASDINWKF